ncbi:MAG: phosphotransferase [archaeon]
MKYKVCILAAGENKHVSYAENFHVALLPIGTKAAISKIIDKFPEDIEIIIAVGYNSDLIKNFINMVYPRKNITFVDIANYSEPGSGPGRSLLMCKNHLMCPFIFTSADTIVSEEIPEPTKNWIGVSRISDSAEYCMAEVENNVVTKFYVKIPTPMLLKISKNYKTILNNAFIGMAGVHDYDVFWDGLERNQELVAKKLQVSNGLSELISHCIEAIPFFNWFYVGNEAGYNFANRFFEKNPVIIKPDEFIYFENGKVIKYFKDKEIVKQRIERAFRLRGIVPEIVDKSDNFYSYDFIEGQTLSKINDVKVFRELLGFCEDTIWQKKELNDADMRKFFQGCKKFYYDKTMDRIDKFYRENKIEDREEIINGERVPRLRELLKQLDWEKISQGVPTIFHGDIQPENILICKKGFRLIDWRHNFAGNIEYGDIYYDFAKLHHALVVTHDVIRKNQFDIQSNKDIIGYDFFMKSNLMEYKDIFEKFVADKGYDLDKLKILSALTFLNIAPLHHLPYNKFLYYLGKYSLFKEIGHNNSYKLKNMAGSV